MKPILVTEAARVENQDRAVILRAGEHLVLVVADGAGGRSGGTEAATRVVELAAEAASRLLTAGHCVELLLAMDRQIEADPVAGETTGVIVVATPDAVFGASVGDSGAWIVTSNGHDDLTLLQARKPFLGSGAASPVSFVRSPRPAGALLLATDGLLKYTSSKELCRACRDREAGAATLLGLVRLPSGNLPDDTTFILCRL